MRGDSATGHIPDSVHRELIRNSILAMGKTAPNPSVACVIEVIPGEREGNGQSHIFFSGGTEIAGGRHAEIVAFDKYDEFVRNGGLSLDHTLKVYVTLEPCSRVGRTPACTTRLLKYINITDIHILHLDPTLQSEGVQLLERGGIRVFSSGETGNKIAEAFMNGFFHRTSNRGPRYHIKTAVTSVGYMGHRNRRLKISGPGGRRFGMLLRMKTDAVLVGPGTAMVDVPGLDLRFSENSNPPLLSEKILSGNNGFTIGENQSDGNTIAGSGQTNDTIHTSSHRLFLESMQAYAGEMEELARQSENQYQGERIIILGDPFEREEELLEKQRQLEKSTNKRTLYLLLESSRHHREGHLEHYRLLPDLRDASFAVELRRVLGELGYNDVLIEGGMLLLESLWDNLYDTDHLYVLQSKSEQPDFPESDLIRPPEYLLRMMMEHPLNESILDLGDDILYATTPGKIRN